MIVTTDNQFTFREAESGTYSSTFVSSFNGRDGVVVLTADDVTAALGYIPGTGSGTVTVADVTGLQAALDSKQPVGDYANAVHTHVIGDVTGLQAALDSKQVVGNYANLDGGTEFTGDVKVSSQTFSVEHPTNGASFFVNLGQYSSPFYWTTYGGVEWAILGKRTGEGNGVGRFWIDGSLPFQFGKTPYVNDSVIYHAGNLDLSSYATTSALTTGLAGKLSAVDNTYWGVGKQVPLGAVTFGSSPSTKGSVTLFETTGLGGFEIDLAGGTSYAGFGGLLTANSRAPIWVSGSVTGWEFEQQPYFGTNPLYHAGNLNLSGYASVSTGNTFSGNQVVNGELTVTSTRTTGGDPQVLFNVEKAATNGGVFGFRRTSSANQVLVAFETASGANPDGYFGTVGGVEDRIFFLSGAGGTGSFAIDPSGLMIGNGIDTGSFAASPASISSAGAIKGTSLVVSGTVNATNVSNTNTGDETYSSITTKLAAGSGGGTSNFLRADGTFAPPPSGGGGTTTNAVTFNNAGAGAVSGTTFDGSAARTISYNTVGAAAATHTHAYTDINNVGTGTVMYRKTAGTGAAETQTLATLKTDLGLSGTNTGDQTTISGNAGSATVLQTARTINGTSFNGSANITVTAVNPFSATFNNSGTGVVSGTSHNGSAAQTISYNTIGAAPATRTISTTAPLTGGGDLSANRTLAISAATTSAAGSMSSADKTKLDTVVSGTYTPTVAGLSNVDSVAAWPLQYVRVGNVVTVSGRVEIDATSVGSVTRISMSLPITTAFSGANQAGGVASSSADSSPAQVLAIYANPSSSLVWFDGRAQSASSLGHWFSFTYQII